MELTERIFDNPTVCCKTTELHLFSLQKQCQDIGKHRCDDEKLGGEDDDEDEKAQGSNL